MFILCGVIIIQFEFNYLKYIDLLNKLLSISKVYRFKDLSTDVGQGFILRHDVDFDIEKAYILSNLEMALNTTATYFVLMTSEMYNVHDRNNRTFLRNMIENGFEVGIHFDPTVYGDASESEMNKFLEYEVDSLQNIIGEKVTSVSLHNPSVHGKYPLFKGYANAYDSNYFNKNNYISDSCMRFRDKDVYDFIESGRSQLLQLVFHPIHFSENGDKYIDIFSGIFKDKINEFHERMTVQNYTYSSEVGRLDLFNSILHEGE